MMSMCRFSFLCLMIFSIYLNILGVYFLYMNMMYFIEWEICSYNSSMILMTILLDWMSLMFMGFVLFISSLVIFYSEDYMAMDYNINRFIILVLLFVFSMMMMIISPNLISILLGWDGLGLVSYCLVIYYQNNKSYNAGMLTILMNRIGDVTLLLSISWMLNFGSWNYMIYMNYMLDMGEMQMISLLVVISAMTKSAQIPFSSWLPAAMAAPTPVSALVHSSTLVTAGVYLMIRFNELIIQSNLSVYLLMISSMTMFMSGLVANYEYDFKKIIALSTLSQLGLMMSSLSFGMPVLAFFHLLMHAMFKSLLFLCAGSIIHIMKNFQDIRVMGGMNNSIILVGVIMSVANLALCGLPFLAGFYSKDLILESYSMMTWNWIIYILFYISTGLTMMYSFRLTVMLFINMVNFMSLMILNYLFDFKIMVKLFLMVMSIISGSVYIWFIFDFPQLIILSMMMKFNVLVVMMFGLWLGFSVSNFKLNDSLSINMLKLSFLGNMWFLTILSVNFINYPMNYSIKFLKFMDQGWFELFGSQNMYYHIKKVSFNYMKFQINVFMLFMISVLIWVLGLMMMYLY